MIIKFNPTGTSAPNGVLTVRADVIPDVTCETYRLHHLLKPDGPIPLNLYNPMGGFKEPDFSEWLQVVGKHEETNPMLTHFIQIGETTGRDQLIDFLGQVFSPNNLKSLDSALALPDSIHRVSPFMRDKSVLSPELAKTKDIADLILDVNSRFARLELEIAMGKKGFPLKPLTITIGSAATERGTNLLRDYSLVCKDVSATGTGTINTEDYWMQDAVTDGSGKIGIVYVVSGDTLKCRSSKAVGDMASGSKQTVSGLTLAVQTGDYNGTFFSGTGSIEADSSGYTGIWRVSGDYMDVDDQAEYGVHDGYTFSLYGTGTETAVGQPTMRRWGGIPHMTLTGRRNW